MLSKRGTSTRPPIEMLVAMVSVVVVDVRAPSKFSATSEREHWMLFSLISRTKKDHTGYTKDQAAKLCNDTAALCRATRSPRAQGA